MQVPCTLHLKGSERYIDISFEKGVELSNKAFLVHRAGYCIKLDRHKSKDKENTGCFEINLMF